MAQNSATHIMLSYLRKNMCLPSRKPAISSGKGKVYLGQSESYLKMIMVSPTWPVCLGSALTAAQA